MKQYIRIANLIGNYLLGNSASEELVAWKKASPQNEALFHKIIQVDELAQ